MNTSVAKKAGQAVRLLMMVLTAVLIFFFINVMLLVSDIQGTRMRASLKMTCSKPWIHTSTVCVTEVTTSTSSVSTTMSIRQK